MAAPPLGRLLLDLGVIPDEAALADVLARQSERMPLASICYVLGYAAERDLAAALGLASGRPAVVLDECVIDTSLVDGVAPELLLRLQLLPVYADGGGVHVAASRPDEVADHAAALFGRRGRAVVVHVALAITVARTVRGVLTARARDQRRWVGPEARADGRGAPVLAVVSPDDTLDDASLGERAAQAVIEDVTKEIAVDHLFPETAEVSVPGRDQHLTPRAASVGADTPWPVTGVGSGPGREPAADTDPGEIDEIAPLARELECGPAVDLGGPPRLLIVDDDFATRHLLVKEIEPRGYVVDTAASGSDAIETLRGRAPDVVIADILLPGVDGFRLCRAIKRTQRLTGVGVILMSAVIDSGRVTAEVLEKYGADGYAAKPLDTARLLRMVRELVGRRRARTRAEDDAFDEAIARYQAGDVDGAIELLRDGVALDPAAARVRFALANLLQKEARIEEAIDEYESVIELEPRYFPALTRLAYLYYKKGHTLRAVEIWRRALPHCEDPALRRNIELFVRKLAQDSLAAR
ncbi:MAG: response regulator [Kofleriaceae bacterium]|nr:response regulator [Kofleriaceae bacterium]